MTEEVKEPNLKELHELQTSFAKVLSSQAFQHWRRVVEDQAEARLTILGRPLKSQEEVYEQEYQKGEKQAILLAVRMWELLQADVNSRIEDKLSSMTTEEREAYEARGEVPNE